jgi:hypothetical protein
MRKSGQIHEVTLCGERGERGAEEGERGGKKDKKKIDE